MEWNEEFIVRTLREMREQEQIPQAERQSVIRSQLLGKTSVSLYAVETRLGWMGVASSDQGIRFLQLPRPTRVVSERDLEREFPDGVIQDKVPEAIARELRDYAEGRCRVFHLNIDLSLAKPFQRAVLDAIRRIPFGETRTYMWVAREVGKPKAARAVGQALHTNPVPIIIPCHRVIASDGTLGGYGGGLALKQQLLRLEGAVLT